MRERYPYPTRNVDGTESAIEKQGGNQAKSPFDLPTEKLLSKNSRGDSRRTLLDNSTDLRLIRHFLPQRLSFTGDAITRLVEPGLYANTRAIRAARRKGYLIVTNDYAAWAFIGVLAIIFGPRLWGATPWGKRTRRQTWEKRKGDLSVSCTQCGKLAEPIPATRDRYRCGSCGSQFAGPRHDLKPMDRDLEDVRL